MHNEQESLFAAVDALLEEAAAQDVLPHPDERKRLREAAGLSQDQVAKALSVRRETVTSWETGRTEPPPPHPSPPPPPPPRSPHPHPRTPAPPAPPTTPPLPRDPSPTPAPSTPTRPPPPHPTP
ncbi:helix-turn-helix transcriptional regulator, partial [Streptomyces bambusae]|nr:helix-turn-helix domain-containing protein [Streptomyces bambusae]